jgi:hypothetical protein
MKKKPINQLKRSDYTSFRITKVDREHLEFLQEVYQESASGVIRRLIQDAYSIIKYRPDQTKTRKNENE